MVIHNLENARENRKKSGSDAREEKTSRPHDLLKRIALTRCLPQEDQETPGKQGFMQSSVIE
jgi:hypothetical protein